MDLENYKPFESHLCGNDLLELQEAHARCRKIAADPQCSWRDRERAWELLKTTSLKEYQQVRENWQEIWAT